MAESILIVDDEETVRRTFREWLSSSGLDCEVHAVADAEAALVFANAHPIDLAVLDWNLGSGSDGLQLLEDLVEFHPEIVAILITGFAHQATPLDALRMGVRDYLDKNQDLNRETFLSAVRKQLAKIIPAKRQREFTRSLFAFREAVEKVLPLVQASAAMNDRVPLPDAIRSLIRFLMQATQAGDGVLVARHVPPEGPEIFRAFGSDGAVLPSPDKPFEKSLAASVVSMAEPCVMRLSDGSFGETVELQSFEREHRQLLAVPIRVAAGTVVVIELFDKSNRQDFDDNDRKLVSAASDLGMDLLRQAISERQTSRTLFNAVEAALKASQSLAADSMSTPLSPPPSDVLESLRAGLNASDNALIGADASLRLAEAIRVLALRYGNKAVAHCTAMIESLNSLLDELTSG